METSLSTYRNLISQMPGCEEAWFVETLAKCRAGDSAAGREIGGRCLGRILELVEKNTAGTEDELFDLIQDANAVLPDALVTFRGSSAAEFFPHLERLVIERLESLQLLS